MSGHCGFVALIPARLASSRLPGKPLADIAGLPMVVHVARRATASGAARVVVCGDDARILDACRRHGVEAVLTSAAHASGTDRLAEAAAALRLPASQIVVNVQGDEPLIPPHAVAAVARLLERRKDCDIATCAHPIDRLEELFDPNVVKVVLDRDGTALLFSRAPIPWHRDAFAADPGARSGPLDARHGALRHVGLYAYRATFLLQFNRLQPAPIETLEMLEQLRALWNGSRIAVERLDGALPRGVDTPEDLELARRLLQPVPGDAGAVEGAGSG